MEKKMLLQRDLLASSEEFFAARPDNQPANVPEIKVTITNDLKEFY
jgi:hypothetical protein